MSTALYRRYRPETFADVIGQEHVTEPLMQALRTGRTHHAYLFSGPRGCGKTTSARILARCLNCAQGPTPGPCGACQSCVALARSGAGSVDVIEIDAASHGGVDDARDLRERASYGPAQSRFKIYIIDEAHMVTPQGFNALLKIVEEPPEHVKFVFATTEPEKVIGTIRSRTHHYPFHLVPPQRLTDYLEQVCGAEDVRAEPGVLSFVTRAGAGSVRDSLSVLDQLIAGSGPEGLTYERAAALLGFTDTELLDATVDAFAAGDAAAVFHQVDRVIESGHDPRRFVEDLLERLRDLIIVAAVQDGAAAVLRGVPEDQLDRMRQQAASFGPASLSRAADIVNQGLTDMGGATSPRLQLELICARVLLPGAAGADGHGTRLDRLERRLEMGGVPQQRPPAAAPALAPPTGPAGPPAEPSARSAEPDPAARSAEPDPAARSAEPDPAARSAEPDPAARSAEPDPAARSAEPDPAAPSAEPDPAARVRPGVPSEEPAPDRLASGSEVSPAPAPPRPAAPAGVDTEAIRRAWPDVLDTIKGIRRATWTFLSEHSQVLDYDGTRLLLGINTSGLAETFRRGHHREVVRQALIDVLGLDTTVEGRPPEDRTDAGPGGQGPAFEPGPTAGPPSGAPAPAPAPAAAGATGRGDDTGAVDDSGPRDAIGSSADNGQGGAARPVGLPPDAAVTGADLEPEDDPGSSGRLPAVDGPGPEGRTGTPEHGGVPFSSPPEVDAAPQQAGAGPRVVDDGDATEDDEDVETSGAVGQPVIETVLGGRVIAEFDK